ncbi:MAG: hypothetical protein V1837_03220 [Candidatus Woesearchaeota archaeon]
MVEHALISLEHTIGDLEQWCTEVEGFLFQPYETDYDILSLRLKITEQGEAKGPANNDNLRQRLLQKFEPLLYWRPNMASGWKTVVEAMSNKDPETLCREEPFSPFVDIEALDGGGKYLTIYLCLKKECCAEFAKRLPNGNYLLNELN